MHQSAPLVDIINKFITLSARMGRGLEITCEQTSQPWLGIPQKICHASSTEGGDQEPWVLKKDPCAQHHPKYVHWIRISVS
jgi:hypothetical protein